MFCNLSIGKQALTTVRIWRPAGTMYIRVYTCIYQELKRRSHPTWHSQLELALESGKSKILLGSLLTKKNSLKLPNSIVEISLFSDPIQQLKKGGIALNYTYTSSEHHWESKMTSTWWKASTVLFLTVVCTYMPSCTLTYYSKKAVITRYQLPLELYSNCADWSAY